MGYRLRVIGLILLCSQLSARELSWNWWPTGIQDSVSAGEDTLRWTAGIRAVASSGENAPSLMWHNTYGDVSLYPISGNLSGGIYKEAVHSERWWDYDFGVQLTLRAPEHNQIFIGGYFNQLYAHVRLYIFDITAGIQPRYWGAGDAELSSGSLLFSNNAHPIPQIRVGIERWTAVPGLFGYVEVKGGLTHGWLADNYQPVKGTLLHHKFIGGRIGGKLPVNLSYEFHHVAQWGGHSQVYGDLGNSWAAFKSAFLVTSGGTMKNDQLNAQGNHIGFQQVALDVKGEGWKVSAYWQAMNEDGPIRFIGFGMNNKDGLWGVSMQQSRWPFIAGVTYEFVNTTDQSGPFHDRDGVVYGGNDSYYSNSIYTQGWTYYGRIIGSPLLSMNNSRVMAHHVGVKGDIYGFRYRAMVTYADNYGTYKTPVRSHNTAVLLEVKKTVPQAWGLEFGLALGGDFGTQFGNTFGGMITITKRDIIKTW